MSTYLKRALAALTTARAAWETERARWDSSAEPERG